MHDRFLVGIIDGGRDLDAADTVDLDGAFVAGLAAGRGIEHGAVEDDAAAVGDASDACLAGARVGIGAIELLGHWDRASSHSANTVGISARGTASQGGTGSPFEAMNAGLNSFDWYRVP